MKPTFFTKSLDTNNIILTEEEYTSLMDKIQTLSDRVSQQNSQLATKDKNIETLLKMLSFLLDKQ